MPDDLPTAMIRNKEDSSVAVKEPQHRWISALLFAGHILETSLQLYLCYHYWYVATRWAASMSVLLLATVITLNVASIIGVHRSLDFADRWFGQCLCYVMHFSLFGMVWRYLKLALIYDRTDVREFALLRFVQVHLQTLPSLLLQSCLIYQGGLVNVSVVGLPAILALLQLFEAAMTIALSTFVLSSRTLKGDEESGGQYQRMFVPSLSRLCQTISSDKTSDDRQEWSPSSGSIHQYLIVTVRCVCLLWCRIVAVGVFMTEFHVWTLIVFGVHWCIALLWLVLQDSPSESGQKTPSPAVSLFRRALVAYLLVFDWPPRYRQSKLQHQGTQEVAAKSAGSWLDLIGVGGHPRSVAVAVYYGVNGVENAAMLSLWFHFAPASELVPAVARLSTLASCTAAFTLGVLCVMATTQPPNDLSKSMTRNSHQLCVGNDEASKPFTQALTPTHSNVDQERKTVTAEIHKSRLMQPNTLSVPVKTYRPDEQHRTDSWERVSVGDESSNSRNTNTMDGVLMGSGSGSGFGAGSCPSPVLRLPSSKIIQTARDNSRVDTSRSRRRGDCSPYRDPSSFTGSRSSFSALAVLNKPNANNTKTMQRLRCPRSSTPRLIRQNSSCSSLPSIRIKPPPRVCKTVSARKMKHRTETCKRKSFCHCRIFDFDEQQPGMGILFKASKAKTFHSMQGTTSGNHLAHKLAQDSRQFRILCASCLGDHDPLLTKCTYCHDAKFKSLSIRPKKTATLSFSHSKTLPQQRKTLTTLNFDMSPSAANNSIYSTDYPSDTEITCTRKSISSSSDTSYDSDATYTTWPPVLRLPTMERLLSENDTSPWNYVQAWLVKSNQAAQPPPVGCSKTLHGRSTASNWKCLTSEGAHLHSTVPRVPMEQVYSVYCTVPPRLGKSSRDLTLPWSQTQDQDYNNSNNNSIGIVV